MGMFFFLFLFVCYDSFMIYHCSNFYISEFNFTNGVHFGGYYSALEAGLRKVGENDVLFIHSMFLKECVLVESEDVGSSVAWEEVMQREKANGFDGVFYTNKYEPDVRRSYFLWNDVVECVKITQLTGKTAQEKLDNSFLYM